MITEKKVSFSEADSSCSIFCNCATLLSSWRSRSADDESVKMERHLAAVLVFVQERLNMTSECGHGGNTSASNGLEKYLLKLVEIYSSKFHEGRMVVTP